MKSNLLIKKITSLIKEKKGWNIHSFDVHSENSHGYVFWHCVLSNTTRISMGLEINEKTVMN